MTPLMARIRAALGVRGDDAARRRAVAERLRRHPQGPIPARAQADREALLAAFRSRLEARQASVESVPDEGAAVAAVRIWLARHALPLAAVVTSELSALDWGAMRIEARPPGPEDRVGIAIADLGIAETGSLVFFSAAGAPITLAFVPETHIVLVPAARIHGPLEAIWAHQRAHFPGLPPRSVSLVSGPSRTADIEQTIELGAHGPKRLHVILVEAQSSPCAARWASAGANAERS